MTAYRRRRVSVTTSIVVPLALLIGVGACGRSANTAPAPASPESTVREFLAAVKANSLVAMGDLWGTKDGPMAGRMARDQLEKRLTVMRIYLEHDKAEIVPATGTQLPDPNRRELVVRIERNGCTSNVPFTLVRWRSGWLVSDIDLAAAGNPQRVCPPGAGGG